MPKARSPKSSGSKASDGEEASPVGQGAAFPVVGVGASAGGLEALTQLLKALPCDTGMGFVIVQHLAPAHASSLSEILSRATKMPVCEVREEPAVEPDHVYVIPPGRDMIISGGRLLLLPQERNARHRGIDQFFRSLAEDSGHQAIGVVLSGSATDGTLGLEVIKAEGGVTFAQDESAQHDSMPKSAVASGCVDFVLPPEGIAQEIARIARHPYVAAVAEEDAGGDGSGHGRIAEIMRRATGVDFTHYKAATMQRRIQRRMMVHKIETLAEYEEHLRGTPGEIEALYQDVLISVTSFFRNPEAFEVLAKKIFPKLLTERTRQEPVRIWTLGCSTGEEAYSLAMLFAECAEAAKSSAQVQLFASDLNASCIDRARVGRYPRSISQDVSPDRLRKFFIEEDGAYRVSKSIRERVVFSRHNVLADPPFSRVDFISCRNLLIYLEPVLQQQVMPLLHYALKPGGHLWLGSSESVGTSRALFEVEDARHKIFTRRPGPTPPGTRFRPAASGPIFPTPAPGPRETPATMLHRDAERVLLAKYAPPGVVVNAALHVVQFRGETGAYLAPAAGLASHELLKMLREGLLVPVRTAIARAESEGRAVREEGARVRSNGGHRELAVEVIPLKAGLGREAGFVILFDEGRKPEVGSRKDDASETSHFPLPTSDLTADDEVARLTQELAATREYLQSVIEQQDSVNEELQSANEEAQSANEEMQSVNEELETSKEEIQSSSEELATVNDELNHRNNELNGLNNDLTNVLGSTQLSIVIVTRDLRIRRFTPVAEKTLNLVVGDVGRPLGDIKLSAAIPELAPLLREVIDTVTPCEREMQDAQGRWFSLRARPYLTHDNKIDGAVVTFVDVDTLRRARDYAENIVASVRVPLVVLDTALRVRTASRVFYEDFRVAPAETEGRLIYDLGNGQWDIPALRTLLEELLPEKNEIEDYEVRHTFEEIGPRIMLLNARRLEHALGDEEHIILSIEDVTARRSVDEALAEQARLLDLTNDGIVVCDMERRIGYWNAGAEKLYGWRREEALGKISHELLETESAVPFAQIEEELLREGQWVGEFVHTRQDGGRITVLVRKSLDRDAQGQPRMVLQNITDITQRKAAEVALRASEEFKRSVIESSPDCIKVLDLAGRLLSLEAGRELLGLEDVTPLLGQPWVDLWKNEDRAAAQAAVVTAAAGGEGHFVGFFRTFDGHDKWWDVAISPIRNAHGQPARLLAVSRDVTERRAAEQALHESEARFRAAVGAVSSLIWTNNAQGMMEGEQIGWGSFTGQSREEYQGHGWAKALHPEDAQPTIDAWGHAVAERRPFEFEHRVRRRDGAWRICSVRAVPVCAEDGAIREWVGVHTDITQSRELEASLVARAEELAQADRSKDEFLAMLAHELRNPLAPLRNAAEILQAAGVSAEERAQAQRIIGRQIENMSRMIDDLLDVSRITEGKISLRKKPVALEAILTAATSLARSGCAAHGQELSVTLPSEPVWLEADATRLEQVFNNLLTNACKYSGDGSHIALTAEVVQGSTPGAREVVVSVKDDGAGIDPELLPRVFDLFVQATRALDRAHGGLGIGLTLVQRLVKLHGGTITAHSDGLDQGAEFIVRLPILREAPPPLPPPAPVAQEVPRRILIVDDNTDSARSLAMLQKRRGHETRTAFTGPDAVTGAAEFRPEVVLLDIGLPGMDGFEVARQIRAMPALAGVFIIAMSGYGRDEDRAEAKLAGFDEYLVKPVDLEQLRTWLRARK